MDLRPPPTCLIRGLLALVLLGLLGACRSSLPATASPKDAPASPHRVVFVDPPLAARVSCTDISIGRHASGRLDVVASLHNRRARTIDMQIKLKFTRQGEESEDTGWIPYPLPRRETVVFRHLSLSPADDFRILLRQAR